MDKLREKYPLFVVYMDDFAIGHPKGESSNVIAFMRSELENLGLEGK